MDSDVWEEDVSSSIEVSLRWTDSFEEVSSWLEEFFNRLPVVSEGSIAMIYTVESGTIFVVKGCRT